MPLRGRRGLVSLIPGGRPRGISRPSIEVFSQGENGDLILRRSQIMSIFPQTIQERGVGINMHRLCRYFTPEVGHGMNLALRSLGVRKHHTRNLSNNLCCGSKLVWVWDHQGN